mgnify:CR=1 FL=1
MLSIKHTKIENQHNSNCDIVHTRIVVSKSNMKKLGINTYLLDLMFENFFNQTSFIQYVVVDTVEEDEVIEYNIKIVLVEDSNKSKCYLPILKLIIKQGISKGVFSLYRYVIEKHSIMNGQTLVDEDWWSMTCEIPNHSYLAYFDTTEIHITPSLEVSNKMGPINAYNMLSSLYIATGLMRCHTTLLSQHQARFGSIRRVEKNPEDEMSTISKIAFIKPLKDLQEAVKNHKIEKVDDISSCILLGMPIKQGTGAFDVCIDLWPYLNNTDSNKSRITELTL